MKEFLTVFAILVVMSCGEDHSACKNGIHIRNENELVQREQKRIKFAEYQRKANERKKIESKSSDNHRPSGLEYKLNPVLKYTDPVGYMLTPSLF